MVRYGFDGPYGSAHWIPSLFPIFRFDWKSQHSSIGLPGSAGPAIPLLPPRLRCPQHIISGFRKKGLDAHRRPFSLSSLTKGKESRYIGFLHHTGSAGDRHAFMEAKELRRLADDEFF
jgi:hypothetical protein